MKLTAAVTIMRNKSIDGLVLKNVNILKDIYNAEHIADV
jgi:hypothetical protein